MVYLDYSATTFVNDDILKTFTKVCKDFPGNANSLHDLGLKSRDLMKSSVKQIADLLNVFEDEIILTSGASEANNLALKGIAFKYKNRGKHIISTKLEHSSVLNTLNYLETLGYEIDYLEILPDGKIDLNDLKKKIRDDTILVSISQVNSEIGIIQDIDLIGKILKEYKKVIFHVDGTQAIGKINVNLASVDLYSFSGHKIYGLDGVGCLVKKRKIELTPLIHGGKSQTIYRSGTPCVALYASLAKALRLVLTDFDKKYNYVKELNEYLKDKLKKIDGVIINSNANCVYHIVNLSVLEIKPETMLHALASKDIYISTKTACSDDSSLSLSVLEFTKNKDLARSSIRISLSYLTTKDEIDYFINIFKEKVNELRFKKGK